MGTRTITWGYVRLSEPMDCPFQATASLLYPGAARPGSVPRGRH
jgi:hypothetical protein